MEALQYAGSSGTIQVNDDADVNEGHLLNKTTAPFESLCASKLGQHHLLRLSHFR